MDGNVAPWVGIGLLAAGQIGTFMMFALRWNKNSSRNVAEDATAEATMQADISYVKKEIDDPEHGLSALKDDLAGFKQHCATVSTGLKVKVEEHDRRISAINNRPAKRRGKTG